MVHATCYTMDNKISGSGSLTKSPSSFFVLGWHWCVLSQAWAMVGSSLPLVLPLCMYSLYCHVVVAREPFCWSIKGEGYSYSFSSSYTVMCLLRKPPCKWQSREVDSLKEFPS